MKSVYDGNVRIVAGQCICSNYKLFSEILFMKYYNNISIYTCIHKVQRACMTKRLKELL